LSSYSPTPLYLMLGLLIVCALFGGVFLAGWRRGRRRYEVRLRQLSERERVATGLHDTLLQSMQGMILRFQGVSHRLPAGSPERATIETILDQADEVLAEGRHQILALRMPVVYGDDLSQAFAAIGQSLEESFNTPFRLVVTARPVAVNGDCGEEIYGIAREALYNAFQHAQAGHIELELVYGCEFLSLYVRDDGRGMAGAPQPGAGDGGYRGLAGMRGRAERMGGGIEVHSLPERGTEVILKVPGEICYQAPLRNRWRRLTAWLGRTEVRD
jgi:signal transduction histidine kinase